MSILRDKIINEHIDKNYPNSKIINYDSPESDLVFYSSDELQNVEDDWFPLSCHKDKTNGKAIYGGRRKVFHTYTEGETGAGKTTRFVMQSILALSSMKIKPSFVIVDIHGEIIENLYNHLKQNGYKIRILNCDDPQRSDTYNPFSEIADECVKTRVINNDHINKIRRISEIMQPVESKNDPIWEQGARSYTNGCILDKFEDLINGDIPEECVTLYNVIQNHYWLRDQMTKSMGLNDLFSIPHYKKKGSKALSTQKMIAVTNNAEKTRASYFGVVENHFDDFGQPTLYRLSSSNTIDISDFIDEPTVIVIQSGSTRIGDDLISLLVNEIYTQVVKVGRESKSKKLPRNIHCFLDEFANCNIADGPQYIKMLTTSRKFGMFWHMILQCDAQLDRKFDANIGRIIRANSTEIFMGSHDYETEVRFARSCGQKTIESLSSVITRQDPRLEVVDLMTTERLNLTEEGYAYIKSNRHSLLKTYIEAFYKCDEFVPVDDIDSVYPDNNFDYQQTEFLPSDIPAILTEKEYEVVEKLKSSEISYNELKTFFPKDDLAVILETLQKKDVVSLHPNRIIKNNLTKRQMQLLEYRKGIVFSAPTELKPEKEYDDTSNNDEFDYFDYDDPFSFKGRKKEDDKIDLNEWLMPPATENSIFISLKDHVSSFDVPTVLKDLEKLTFTPSVILDSLSYIIEPTQKNEEKISMPSALNVLKFEIIEQFIASNNFKTKGEWVKAMEKELKQLKGYNYLPESILKEFENAVRELRDELSLNNILEIKKIISG